MAWLRAGVSVRWLIINDAKALVNTVDGTLYLVSPGVFQHYAQEHPHVAGLARQENIDDWQWVQKRFEKLQLHRKQSNGLNIWTCEVTGPRKTRRLHGYLIKEPLIISINGHPALSCVTLLVPQSAIQWRVIDQIRTPGGEPRPLQDSDGTEYDHRDDDRAPFTHLAIDRRYQSNADWHPSRYEPIQ